MSTDNNIATENPGKRKTVLIATHDLNLIRQAKSQLAARVLRITKRRIQLAGADL